MQYHNHTLQELINISDREDNPLAAAILGHLIDSNGEPIISEESQEYKEELIAVFEDKLNDLSKSEEESYHKEGHNYVSHLEAFSESVSNYVAHCPLRDFKTHVLGLCSSESYHSGGWHNTYHIDEIAFKKLESLGDDHWEALRVKCSEDIDQSLTDNHYTNWRSIASLYTVSFGEVEIPLDQDTRRIIEMPDCLSFKDLEPEGVGSNNDYIYIDLTSEGIEYHIDLDWLEEILAGVWE